MNDGGLENMWLMDFGCSRHMTEEAKWFSNLTPMQNKESVMFRDDNKGKVKTKGIININEHFISMDVALVEHLNYKFLYVSLMLVDGLEISF
jgi:hypothetical protein